MSSYNKAQSKHSDQIEGLDTDPHREAQEEQSNQVESHPLLTIFSLLDGPERDALKESIQKNGIREPIVLFEGKILDGRNRYYAARALNLSSAKIPIRQFEPERDGNPIDFVWDQNINRRHLNETQRGLAAAQMEILRHGGNRKSQWAHMAQSTRRKLARRYGVGRDTIYCMSLVLDSGGPEL